jgi:hypothetical protein
MVTSNDSKLHLHQHSFDVVQFNSEGTPALNVTEFIGLLFVGIIFFFSPSSLVLFQKHFCDLS